MIWKWFLGCLLLGIASCGLCNQKKKDQKMTNMNNSKGVTLEIVDNVSNELWQLHPTLHFMRGELMAMARLAGDYASSDGSTANDSEMRADAQLFWDEMETEYMSYEPSELVVAEIDSALRLMKSDMVGMPCRIDLLMIGGNWCSDTRMGLPRLCKVLDVLMASTEGNVVRNREELECAGVLIRLDYRRVNREKKLIDGAFAGDVFFGGKSVVIGRVPELAVAKLPKKSGVQGSGADVDFAAESVYVGSILEMPQVSWEADLLALIKK